MKVNTADHVSKGPPIKDGRLRVSKIFTHRWWYAMIIFFAHKSVKSNGIMQLPVQLYDAYGARNCK